MNDNNIGIKIKLDAKGFDKLQDVADYIRKNSKKGAKAPKIRLNDEEIASKGNEVLNKSIETIAGYVKIAIQSEVPVRTGNLKYATTVGKVKKSGTSREKEVFTDEKKAPYAPHVFHQGLTRNYEGNDWISRAIIRVKSQKGEILSVLTTNLSRILSK